MAKKKPTREADAVEESAAPKKRRKGADAEGAPVLDINSILSETLDTIAKRQGFESSSLESAPPMSTGCLAMDVIYGGGIRPAMYTHLGMEQSAKTTGALTIMASAVKAGVPIIGFADYEGSTGNSRPYVQAILRSQGLNVPVERVFGSKDPETGKWLVRPIVRYRQETILEKFYDWLSEILRELPDKRRVGNKWWLVFDDTKANKAKYDEYADASMSKKYGKGIWIPAQDDKLQGIFLVDSYPAMNPEARDVEDVDNGIALNARAFSKHLPRVKGRLGSKMVAIIGINQLRAVPMAMYGPSEAEPCGNALKLNSDARLKFTSRALSAAPFKVAGTDKKNSSWEVEPSVQYEGQDKYRYVHVKAIKNKMSLPGREAFLRIWISDAMGVAQGIDPVFDVIYYLKETGQLIGSQRKGFKLVLDKLGEGKKAIPWMVLKRWILGTKEEMSKISTAMGYKPMSLRAFCFKQVQSGVAEKLYVEAHKTKGEAGDDSDDSEE